MTATIRRRFASLFAILTLLVGASFATSNERAHALAPFTGYLMAHFTGESSNNGEQIYLAHSDDGLHWSDLNGGQIVLRSGIGTGGVRDPAIVRSPAGDRYWIIATDLCIGCGTTWDTAANNGSRNLVVWESTDLVNWSAPWLLNVAGAIPDGRNAWAPEAIWNPATNDYVLYWATNVPLNGAGKHRIFFARTSDFRTLNASAQPYITPPGSDQVIDTQIIEVPGSTGGYRYYRANVTGGHITVEGGNSILGTWTYLGNLSNLNISNGAVSGSTVVEGPMWMQFNGRDEWAMWLDQFATGSGYMPITSPNLGNVNNFVRRAASEFNLGTNRKRHGSILNLTQAEETRVLPVSTIGAPGGQCVDVSGDDNGVNGAAVQMWNCLASAADQQWTHNADDSLTTLGRCLDIIGNGTANGTQVQLWDCNGNGGQKWLQQADGSLKNPQSGRCLDDPNGNTANGVRLQIWDCTGGAAQKFSVNGGGVIHTPGVKCVDVSGDDNGGNGAAAQIWNCVIGAVDQHWVHSSDGRLHTLGRCLDITGNGTANGTQIQLWDCGTAGGQVWQQQADGSLKNPQSGRCLDSPGGATANGTRLQIWDCNGGSPQKFALS